MATPTTQFIIRRLTAAEGYLDLGMAKQALSELAEITQPGQFKVPYMWMLGEALKADGRFADAIEPLRSVIRVLPAPVGGRALASLNHCLEQSGQPVEAAADAPPAEKSEAETVAQATLGLELQALQRRLPLNFKIPHVGTISVTLDPGNVLTIKLHREP